jgi:hypothetical protein
VNGLGIPTAFRLRDDDTEVISPPRTGPPYVRIDVASGNKGKRGEREG